MTMVKPSELLQVFVDCVEAKAVPSKAHKGDKFKGLVGPLPMVVRDRFFGVTMGASVRDYTNSCIEEHRATVTLTFIYVVSSDTAAYKRVIDDMALVSEALHDIKTSGVTNADAILEIDVQPDQQIAEGIDERTIEVAREVGVVYNYG